MIPLLIYIAIFVAAFFIVTKIVQGAGISDYTSLKTVTFGDESAVRPNRAAGVISILTLSLIHISEPTRPSKSSRMPSSA